MTSEELKKEFDEKYLPKIQSTIKYLKEIDLSEWKNFKNKDGLKCYQKLYSKKSKLKAYIGVSEYPFSYERILESLYTLETKEKKKWDPYVSHIELVKGYGKYSQKGYLRYKAPSYLVYDRDFIAIRHLEIVDDAEKTVVYHPIISAMEEKHLKGRKKSVHAEIVVMGWIFEYDKKLKRTMVTYVSCCDLKGWIPTWIINITAAAQPECILLLKNASENK